MVGWVADIGLLIVQTFDAANVLRPIDQPIRGDVSQHDLADADTTEDKRHPEDVRTPRD